MMLYRVQLVQMPSSTDKVELVEVTRGCGERTTSGSCAPWLPPLPPESRSASLPSSTRSSYLLLSSSSSSSLSLLPTRAAYEPLSSPPGRSDRPRWIRRFSTATSKTSSPSSAQSPPSYARMPGSNEEVRPSPPRAHASSHPADPSFVSRVTESGLWADREGARGVG